MTLTRPTTDRIALRRVHDVGIANVRVVVGIWLIRRMGLEVDAFARTVLRSIDRVTLMACRHQASRRSDR